LSQNSYKFWLIQSFLFLPNMSAVVSGACLSCCRWAC